MGRERFKDREYTRIKGVVMPKNYNVSSSVIDKHLEIHYNEKTINTPSGSVNIRLKGKIYCPILNHKITPLVCSKLMDVEGWPRCIDPSICDVQATCFIYKSIRKNMLRKKDKDGNKKV